MNVLDLLLTQSASASSFSHPHWSVVSNEVTVKEIIQIPPDQDNSLNKVGTSTLSSLPHILLFPPGHVLWVLMNDLISSHSGPTCLMVLGGQPQTTVIATMSSWDTVSDERVFALALCYQPGSYQHRRGKEMLVLMIELRDSDRSQSDSVNHQYKLVAKSLAHLWLMGECN